MAYFKRFNTRGASSRERLLLLSELAGWDPRQRVIRLVERPTMHERLLLIWIWIWIWIWVRARGWLGNLDFRLGLNGHQFDFKDEGCVGTDAATRAAPRAIGKFRGNKKLPLGSNGHELQRFGPTLDHTADGKCGRLAALVGAIEFGVVEECTLVVADDGIRGYRLWTRSFFQDFVLQATREGDDAVFRLVVGEKRLAFLFVGRSLNKHLLFLFLAHLGLQCDHRGPRFVVCQQRLTAGQTIFQAAQKNTWVNIDRVFVHALADIQTDGVAGFVFLRFERQHGWFSCHGGPGLGCGWLGCRGWRSLWSACGGSLLRLNNAKNHQPRRNC